MTSTEHEPDLAQLLVALRQLLPANALLCEPSQTRAYECDGLTLFRQMPPIVALPESAAQVAAILQLCHAQRVPVVPRGAGTGLSGGALPHAQGLLLSLNRMDRILHIDPLACTATVQPGVRNLAVTEAAARHGLFYAPDPSSQIACTIGGNVSENSGGVHCLKYGLTLHNVLRVAGFTMAGEPIEIGSSAPDAPGLDLLPLVVGSEGMLMVVTEVTLRLVPQPQATQCIMVSFATVDQAADAVAALIAGGVIPAGLEMLDQAGVRMVEPFARAGYDTEAAAVLLCETDGTHEEVAADLARMIGILQAAGATRVQVSHSDAERARFWAGRKAAFPAAGRLAPALYTIDGTIPRRRIGVMLAQIRAMEQRYGLPCPNVFHAGDGNLHPVILFDDADPDSVARAERFGTEIMELSVRLGGTISGEHGIGVEKINQMCMQFDAPTRAGFHAIKQAFDPAGLLNPGKAIPTLHRCAEYGRMHLHRDQLPFPDLPRF